jgi:DNA (cytosine-5)-methyltransferase 1
VFVVASARDDFDPAAVLFEFEGVRRDIAPSRETRESVAASTDSGFDSGGLQRTVGALCADTHPGAYSGQDAYTGRLIPQPIAFENSRRDGARLYDNVSNTLQAFAGTGGGNGPMVALPIALAENTIGRQPQNGGNGNGFTVGGPMYTLNATGIHGVAQPIPLNSMNCFRSPDADPSTGCGIGEPGEAMFTITKTNSHAVAQPIVLMGQGGSVMNVQTDGTTGTLRRETRGHEPVVMAPTLTASNDPSRSPQSTEVTNQVAAVHSVSMAVRRLTCVECERLQGFPDGYTNIPWRKAAESPDGPRYKALGNSWAVPVVAWIGKRIQDQTK